MAIANADQLHYIEIKKNIVFDNIKVFGKVTQKLFFQQVK